MLDVYYNDDTKTALVTKTPFDSENQQGWTRIGRIDAEPLTRSVAVHALLKNKGISARGITITSDNLPP